MSASWLSDAVFYEIYPQTFKDSNGDGIGDLKGLMEKLPYVKSLGCNAIWMNPCFDSPFKDAGYDVRDYKKVAPRYGTNEDLENLFKRAHELGLKILLDLVPGHTSEEHAWFKESTKLEENEYSHRYIWTDHWFSDSDGMRLIGGEFPRNGAYIINYFKCQPALNYGCLDQRKKWQHSIHSPAALATREAIKDIMRFWLQKGCDGFRVDMADSLVKNDDREKNGTQEVWRDIAGAIHREFPEAALVSEWGVPACALNCGFDVDFYLDWGGNGYNLLFRKHHYDYNTGELSDNRSYFSKESGESIKKFLADYLPQYYATNQKGLFSFITCNHDTPRMSLGLDELERKIAFACIFTMPGAPFLYYGDELGMDYRLLPSKEGGYTRTGSRTPMQWDSSKNQGFSDAPEDMLYLPVEGNNAHTVEAQEGVAGSMLEFTKELIALRHSEEDLHNYSKFSVYAAPCDGRLFAYMRGESILVAMNPGTDTEECKLDADYLPIYTIGAPYIDGDVLTMPAQSFVVLKK